MTNIIKNQTIKKWEPNTLNNCDVCMEYSADIKFKGTLLCSKCAKESEITIL